MTKGELKKIITSILVEDRDLLKDLIRELMIELLSGENTTNNVAVKKTKTISNTPTQPPQSNTTSNINKLQNILGLFSDEPMASQNSVMGGSVESYMNSQGASPVKISKALPKTMKVSTENGSISVNNNAVGNAIQQLINSGNFRVE